MDVHELIERFLEETNLKENNDVLALIAYGSRIRKENSDSSDLDILIVTSKNCEYRASMFIDGISIDMTIMSLSRAEWTIRKSKQMGNAFYDSVLSNCVTVIDKFGIYEQLCGLLDSRERKRRYVDYSYLYKAEDYYYNYLASNGKDETSYYCCLENFRKFYHMFCDCSNIQVSKVYDLYENRERAQSIYQLKLPSEDFINEYKKALKARGLDERRQYLDRFLRGFEEIEVEFECSDDFLTDTEIDKKLILLNKTIWKCEDMLLANHPYAVALYHIIMEEIRELYEKIWNKPLDFSPVLDDNAEEMIRSLENAFMLLDYKKNIDYNDFVKRW